MSRDFKTWLSGFRDSISDYSYYVNFDKVYRNVDSIKVEINILNSLIGSENIENEFELLVEKYPETLKCIPILLAVRANEIYAIDGDGEFTYNFRKANQSVEQYKVFMRKTGLFDLLANHLIHNLVDYATGVETGLEPDKAFRLDDFINRHPYDFIIGSSHLVNGKDPYYPEYFQGKSKTEALMEYFESIVNNLKFCKIAHNSYPRTKSVRQTRKSFSILRVLVKRFAYARKAFCAKA